MNPERMKILEMVSSGQITADEAERLISAMEEADSRPPAATGKTPRWLRIRVYDKANDKLKANVNVPLALASIAVKFIPKSAKEKMDEKGIDLDGILTSVKEGVTNGELVEVDHENDRISVVIE